ncbi:hypothetical protein [Maricaulis sp.]|uniref:hypothetical protein n=1 Tax=Maricaulis sp. TaxID=1486257 RepID=UPI00262D3139|nr:hypothetical protein [Maricaulis sp.]
MLVKPLIIAGILSVIAAVPATVPALFGVPVTLSVGPLAAEFQPGEAADLDLVTDCAVRGCPILAVAIGEDFRIRL